MAWHLQISDRLGSLVMTGYFLSLRITPVGGLIRWISLIVLPCWRISATAACQNRTAAWSMPALAVRRTRVQF